MRWITVAGRRLRTGRHIAHKSLVGLLAVGVLAAAVVAAQAVPASPRAATAPAQPSGLLGDAVPKGSHAIGSTAAGTPSPAGPTLQTGSTTAPGGSPAAGGGATPGDSPAAPTQRASAPARSPGASARTTAPPAGAPSAAIPPPKGIGVIPPTGTIVYVHYYLWWTRQHWQDKLGAAYPFGAAPLPLPGQTDASGCSPTVSYPGATVVDIPSQGLYDQSQAAALDSQIATAASFGLTGFVADWAGTGATTQGPSSSGYDARLELLVRRVDAWNATHARKFHLALDFAAFGDYGRPAAAIVNDLRYFVGRYGGDPAFANSFSARPLVMLIGSRQYPLATIQAVSTAARGAVFLLGDETASSLPRDAAYLDGSSYYWSSESPSNSGAKAQIASLGSQLHAARKPWFAPFTAGYDSVLIGGHCVPRNGLATLDTIWSWNSASHPDAWFGVSWNEYVENSYLEPSVKYGSSYIAEVKRLAGL